MCKAWSARVRGVTNIKESACVSERGGFKRECIIRSTVHKGVASRNLIQLLFKDDLSQCHTRHEEEEERESKSDAVL